MAEAAIEHPVRAVQSLGLMLQRQLQARQEAPPQAQERQKPAKSAASPAKDVSDGGVDELFAPRTHTVRVARSKALTRPQRKVMADVMASMQQNPRGLPQLVRTQVRATARRKGTMMHHA